MREGDYIQVLEKADTGFFSGTTGTIIQLHTFRCLLECVVQFDEPVGGYERAWFYAGRLVKTSKRSAQSNPMVGQDGCLDVTQLAGPCTQICVGMNTTHAY